MRIKLIDPNVMYASKRLGKTGDIVSSKDVALLLGIKEIEADKILLAITKKGLAEKAGPIKIVESRPVKKRKADSQTIEVKNGDNSVNTAK
jgi:hypothetical protein